MQLKDLNAGDQFTLPKYEQHPFDRDREPMVYELTDKVKSDSQGWTKGKLWVVNITHNRQGVLMPQTIEVIPKT